MSFLISSYGRIKSYELPHYEGLKVKETLTDESVGQVKSEDFQKELEKQGIAERPQKQKIVQYQREQKKYEKYHRPHYAHEIMSSPVITVSPNTTIGQAKDLMEEHKFHHLPIENDNTIVGLISQTDLLSANRNNTEVKVIMSSEVICAESKTRLQDVAKIMVMEIINCLPVVDQKKHLIGIVTPIDLLRFLANSQPDEFWA